MLPPGHIATALVLSRLARADAPPAAVGALAPDFIDKPLAWVLHVIPGSRYLGHSLLALLLAWLAAGRLVGRRRANGFAVGYLAHLLGDQVVGGNIPWLMPLREYEMAHDRRPELDLTWREVTFETLSLLFVAAWAKRALGNTNSEQPSEP